MLPHRDMLMSGSHMLRRGYATSLLPPQLPVPRPMPQPKSIPLPGKGNIRTPTDFLTASKRGYEQYAAKIAPEESWDTFFTNDTTSLKAAAVPPPARRMILWMMNRYRLGVDLREHVRAPKKPKKFRGWGPKVQKGVRVK
ncbi:uncharacterized protein L969DRAFT_86870 [Mixia osmundae IAM 14324]|uniref:Small ribosomal subunit protein mS41 n=1 Tax=Mixia osmundae (strain CBS 9802 / IAM 14324 / JCM 22182 / KY 12970) TaxID=764103 RepID=G7E8Y6_MIXOS|nr:uncharacterized protein L969DRAFT_86870 [Mixia osmundae IAM 14324]KEI40239.1 hypothetical protein L969DRAFT_86870 [Mixia osmundae IAM 14324]GAA99604.1 hypothetical protein E5Q_06305 [Mixia osmundae IAM 14324]